MDKFYFLCKIHTQFQVLLFRQRQANGLPVREI